MNFKLIALMTAMSMSAAIAQDYEEDEEEEEAPAAQAEAPAAAEPKDDPAPKAEEPAAQDAPVAESNGVFDVLHGNAYNMVASEAGASTIAGDMNAVFKMYGRNLLYVEPSGENASLALTKGGLTYLLAFDNQFDMGLVTAGVAFKGMGFAIDFALGKTWESDEVADNETDISTTELGDIINLKFGMNLGAFDLTANAYWLTFAEEVDTETNANEEDNDYWDLGLNVAISNAPSAKGFFWSAGINILRQASETITKAGATTTETTHDDAFFLIRPFFNFAMPVLGTEKAQVYLGTNTRIPLYFYDETASDRSEFAIYTSPNILAEVSLNENIIVYGGATYDWKVFGYEGEEIKAVKTDKSTMSMRTYSTSANAGIRFKYENLVLEASIADALGDASWSGLIGNFGAFLMF